jgi:hypothetical protein
MKRFISISVALLVGVGIILFENIPAISQGSAIRTNGNKITDDSLLTLVQYRTFLYFWDGAEPVSGMARERFNMDDVYPEHDKNVVTTGGSGFGVMAILVGIERGFITREDGFNRLNRIVTFLGKADRFHGAWPHWLYGETGKVKPFSPDDNGADIVETAYLMQGLLAVRQYFKDGNQKEKSLAKNIDILWKSVDWNWFTQGQNKVLYWHWSPTVGWKMNFAIKGYNECLIPYILAASSPTHYVSPDVYHKGWARNGDIVSTKEKYGYKLILRHNGAEDLGGPLFWAQYSYLGLDPRGLKDRYADYWELNRNQTLIDRQWCIENPNHYKDYGKNCWGLTASYSINGYSGHAPGKDRDLGVISPTAALASFPYTAQYSMEALKFFYYTLGDKIFGKYGFYDAFSVQYNWYPQKYLAIDEGPIVVMIENYRTGLLWKLFMSNPEVQLGLAKLGFSVDKAEKDSIVQQQLMPLQPYLTQQ